MLAFLPGLFIQAHIDVHRRFLNSIGKNSVPLISLFIGMVFHLFFNWYFVLHLEMGIIGTGIAGVLMNIIVFIIQFSYANFYIKELKKALKWPDKRTFQWKGLKDYMRIGGPSIILQVLDQWVFEAILILSGFFGVESQASILILMNIASLCFRVSAGID